MELSNADVKAINEQLAHWGKTGDVSGMYNLYRMLACEHPAIWCPKIDNEDVDVHVIVYQLNEYPRSIGDNTRQLDMMIRWGTPRLPDPLYAALYRHHYPERVEPARHAPMFELFLLGGRYVLSDLTVETCQRIDGLPQYTPQLMYLLFKDLVASVQQRLHDATNR